ncbi:unnamed protein product [Chondrus crispus]|uniref:Uncharacterized protein n=1 Tax=Chondrus crispus TaxID=2769 RepID=R7QRN2_CHOCR|nr:unnamed protein product [Chondrus crispus]CDF40809.1 unnamed protein product [Chondrus crispus]|eukprot:XP_005711103.1 unnamed protein product [Chondrus crispus]
MWIPRNTVRCRMISLAFLRNSPFVCQTRCQTTPHFPYIFHVCVRVSLPHSCLDTFPYLPILPVFSPTCSPKPPLISNNILSSVIVLPSSIAPF